jgi:thiol-disulfide isomerase/thioredoxin
MTLALIAFACSTTSVPRGVGTSTGGPLLPATPTALPEFDAARFHQLLAQLHGKPVVVNIWASWCGPCVVEAPGLARLAREYGTRVQFLGVDVLDQRSAAQAFIRMYGWTYPSVFDPIGAIRNDLGFVGQPVTLVFDATGKRTFAASGAVDESQLRKELNAVV